MKGLTVLDDEEQRAFEAAHFGIRSWIFESLRRLSVGVDSNSTSLEELETFKETISCAFELCLTTGKLEVLLSHDESVRLQLGVLDSIVPVLDLFSSGLPESMAARAVYYRFKHAQLTASLHPRLSDGRLKWLRTVVDFWRSLVVSNYFGTDYVMADPFKEGGVAMQELGTMLCSRQAFAEGTEILREAAQLHDKTLSGYDRIRIAARNDIAEARIAYAETLVNLGICGIDQGGLEALQASVVALQSALRVDLSGSPVSSASEVRAVRDAAEDHLAKATTMLKKKRVLRRKRQV